MSDPVFSGNSPATPALFSRIVRKRSPLFIAFGAKARQIQSGLDLERRD